MIMKWDSVDIVTQPQTLKKQISLEGNFFFFYLALKKSDIQK